MSNLSIVRAWKDEDYCESLSQEELAMLPSNPAGLVELTDEDLDEANGQAACTRTCAWTCWITSFAE